MVLEREDCDRSSEAASYLDGELDRQATNSFETHLLECDSCANELKEQRRLLCALDFALNGDDPCVTLPSDFAQVVAANAESDMSGVRQRVEHRRALRLCLGISFAAFALLGSATLYASIFTPIKAFARSSVLISGFAWNAMYDAAVGIAVVLRALGRRLIFESHPVTFVLIFLFAIALALLPRLIVGYHRARITE